MHLGGLESGDADQANRVVVEALVTAQGATEAGLEQVVGRLSLARRSVRCAGGARMTSDSKVPRRHSQRFPAAAAMLDLPQRGG